jgi:hypothetical protein
VKYVLRTIAIGAALSAALTSQAFAQSPPAKAAAPKAAPSKSGSPKSAPKGAMTGVPRLANGKPDFSGVWQVLNTANWDIEAHGAKPASCLRPGVKDVQGVVVYVPCRNVLALGAIGSVPAGLGIVDGDTIPYTPAALKVRDDNRAHALERDPEVKCYLPGVPRANYMPYPFQIYQTANTMLISYEYDGADRQVKFTDPGPAALDSWMGQSVAKWDGDTLVLTVTGQNDRTWLDRSGNHHSADMKVVERYTYANPGVVLYEAEITDPQTFTRPWKISMNLYKRTGKDGTLLQFRCVEFVEELIYGQLRKDPLK